MMLQLKVVALILIWWSSNAVEDAVAGPDAHLVNIGYESNRFYDQTNEIGSGVSCGNISSTVTDFRAAGQQALMDLQTAVPKTGDFYAATKTLVAGGSAVYAVAQCVETATQINCQNCMQVGYNNLQSCLPNTEGRAYDAGCFMRYSTTPFFADNQTINIAPYLKKGNSRKKWGIIGGATGGVVLLLLLFGWRMSRKRNQIPRDVKNDEDGEYLLRRAWKLHERGMYLDLVDKAIDPNEYDVEEVQNIIEIALLCTQASASTRPTMTEVVMLLKSKNLLAHLRPTMPVFVETNMIPREGNSTSSSNATASISVPSAR
ncbi:LRR receptor [Vigna angularis]|uniref:LRR receptor n=1 Tax=Phaseolus angularis TaxID=3914 RepID=A0A8T0K5T6_PHAAN|nr:LRR receptor [Vigna angularis]